MSTLTASHGLTLSATGLKLIKAYEGYRPVDRNLVTGQRVIGYGHRLYDEAPAQISKKEAEDLLKSDLQAFEDMINENVHAPLSQGQFDALVSFAYNIGPKAFLASDTLRALNNGRPLDAANGLDVWRKSTIDGKTYVVDALMRRRTAEKALFLRLDNKPRPASGVDLPPVRDDDAAKLETEDDIPTFTNDPAAGIVKRTPLDAKQTPSRRREDGPAGILMLSEVIDTSDFEETYEEDSDKPWFESNPNSEPDETDIWQSDEFSLPEDSSESQERETLSSSKSVIAEAAADISDRLDALIDKARDEDLSDDNDWPESLIQGQDPEASKRGDEESVSKSVSSGKDLDEDNGSNLVVFPGSTVETDESDSSETTKVTRRVPTKAEIEAAIFEPANMDDEKQAESDITTMPNEEAEPTVSNSASRYIERHAPPDESAETQSNLGFWMIMLTGFLLLGASAAAYLRGAEGLLGEYGPLIILSGLFIGAMMILGAAYYAIRRALQ